jgi:hypothetical protein
MTIIHELMIFFLYFLPMGPLGRSDALVPD